MVTVTCTRCGLRMALGDQFGAASCHKCGLFKAPQPLTSSGINTLTSFVCKGCGLWVFTNALPADKRCFHCSAKASPSVRGPVAAPKEADRAGQVETEVSLLMKCIPHLDLRVSEHNDGYRLRRDICCFLAGLGYPGWEKDRAWPPVAAPKERGASEDYVLGEPPYPGAAFDPRRARSKPHRCPVCEGRGAVPTGFYLAPETNATAPKQCRSCKGAGLVWG